MAITHFIDLCHEIGLCWLSKISAAKRYWDEIKKSFRAMSHGITWMERGTSSLLPGDTASETGVWRHLDTPPPLTRIPPVILLYFPTPYLLNKSNGNLNVSRLYDCFYNNSWTYSVLLQLFLRVSVSVTSRTKDNRTNISFDLQKMDNQSKEATHDSAVVTEDLVKQFLLADKGPGAQLGSWEVVPFTKKGDNFVGVVTSIVVKYDIGSLEFETSYIAKLSVKSSTELMMRMNSVLFEKESNFYLELLPRLNAVAESIGQPQLQFPRCFHSILEMGQEKLYFEDLRRKGFKMFDRRKGMDIPHTTLVLRELARLHSASLLLQAKYPGPIEKNYPCLSRDIFTFCDGARNIMLPLFQQNLSNSVEMLDRIGGYDTSKAWIENLKPELEDIFGDQLKNHKYDVLSHGDCWNNNILFRYSDDGVPIETMFVDLQICRKSSPAVDLNYFLYTSLVSDVRKPNLSGFLDIYCHSFKMMMDAAGCSMPFTRDEIMKEFRAQNKLGAMFAMMTIPALLLEPEEVPDVQGDPEKIMKMLREKSLSMLKANPLVKPRFLSTFDEFIETGLIA